MKLQLHSLRNTLDFYLRQHLKWGRRLNPGTPVPEIDQQLQKEFKDFFTRFPWKTLLTPLQSKGNPLIVADIGARNFAFGPVIDETFKKAALEAEIHGIEIDAFRMLRGFHSRRNFGDFYASKMRDGHFHPMDFLKWDEPLHLALLLNPFVSEEPTVSWGLPLSTLKPNEIFQHTYRLVRPMKGLMLLTCPSPEELEIAKQLAKEAGFLEVMRQQWHPAGKTVQQKSRYGILYRSTVG